ncbi:TPA: SA1002 family membrane protein [Staphylococcus aureus]
MIKVIILLLLMCVLSCILTNKHNYFLFVKSIMYGVLFMILGYASLLLSTVLLVLISLFFNLEDSDYFWLGLIQILLSGIMQITIVKITLRKITLKEEEILVLEHIIQRTIIYFALYQSLVENLKLEYINLKDFHSILLNPSNLNIGFLPALILMWMTIFKFKIDK